MREIVYIKPRTYRFCDECSGYTLLPKLTIGELEDLYSDYYLDDFSLTYVDRFEGDSDGYKKYINTIMEEYIKNGSSNKNAIGHKEYLKNIT